MYPANTASTAWAARLGYLYTGAAPHAIKEDPGLTVSYWLGC